MVIHDGYHSLNTLLLLMLCIMNRYKIMKVAELLVALVTVST